MKSPPLFPLCASDSSVTALLGTNPVRLFMFGMAPQGVQKPYAVWQMVGGGPESYLAGRPDSEGHSIQIDVYGDSAADTRAALAAIEHAIELHCYVTRYGGESRDPETMSYRSSMDISWITER